MTCLYEYMQHKSSLYLIRNIGLLLVPGVMRHIQIFGMTTCITVKFLPHPYIDACYDGKLQLYYLVLSYKKKKKKKK